MTWTVWAAFAALSVIWGLPYLFIKLAVAEIPPVDVAWGRIVLGAAVLLPVAWQRGSLRAAAAKWRAVCAFAVVELVVPFPLISLGERWISSSLTAILIATLPFTVILLAPLFGVHRQLNGRRIAGLACGFTGVVVLLGIDPVQGWLAWVGVACMVAGVLGYAAGSLIVERYLHGVDEFGTVSLSLAVASILLLPATLLSVPKHMPSALAIYSVIVLGVVCTAAALWLYFYLVAKLGAARATVFTYVNPAVATLLGIIVLHERFGWSLIAGLALILIGSWMAAQRV
ncbi:MAG TPA: EamA family transporter [Steroidobacteraceae bacterium]|jgi:drug/metabolite transporter (DMT)-like permease|nr:EamA family transporter [Steroidobacteraceae bacterium]